jgi:hypothetical protein
VIRLTQDQHVEWSAVIADLQAAGHDRCKIAKAIGVPEKRMYQWVAIDCQPRHDDGARLVAYWCSITGKAETSIPVVSRYA